MTIPFTHPALAFRVKRKAIVAGAVMLVVLLLLAILFVPRKPRPDITVRHVSSVQSADITTMTFEIKNQTDFPYVFSPSQVQVRNGNAWTRFQTFDYTSAIQPISTVSPMGLTYFTVDVTNLPAKSVVRFSIRPQKTLLGVNGFVRRAELNLDLKRLRAGAGVGGISMNPYDKNSHVYGLPTEVASDEFVER